MIDQELLFIHVKSTKNYITDFFHIHWERLQHNIVNYKMHNEIIADSLVGRQFFNMLHKAKAHVLFNTSFFVSVGAGCLTKSVKSEESKY